MKNDSTSRQNDEKQSLRQMLIEIYDTLFPADCFFSEKQQRIRRYLFSFGTPMVLMMMVYCSIGAWPIVGPNSPLVLDMNGQYVYFFANLRNIILDDNSLLYSWSRSLGGEFLGMYAYYLASPISWIVALFPVDMITEAIWVMLVLKTGICGFTISVFLDKVYPFSICIGSIWLFGSLQLLGIGLVGEYVGKTYMEVKKRPKYIIESVVDEPLEHSDCLNGGNGYGDSSC